VQTGLTTKTGLTTTTPCPYLDVAPPRCKLSVWWRLPQKGWPGRRNKPTILTGPCVSSVARQMPRYNWKKGTARLPYHGRLRPKLFHSFWVQLPGIHPIQVLFVKDKLPDGFMFPPVKIVPVWTCQGPQPRRQTVTVSISPATVIKVPVPIPAVRFVRRNGLI
jgi:hypothetical protein